MLSFNICELKAYSAALTEQEEWQKWADSKDSCLPQGNIFKATAIPMMQARRMVLADKMAIQLALELNSRYPQIDAVVFASRHGQLARTYKILMDYFKNGGMSPNDFSMSVHNSTAGLFSILAKQNAPISSVAAEDQTFCAGLLESLLALQSGKRQVLFVMFDGEIPEYYQSYLSEQEKSDPYAIGMVLTAGNDWNVQLKQATLTENNDDKTLNALQFIRHFYQQTPSFSLLSESRKWTFLRT